MTFNYQRYHELAAASDLATFQRALISAAEEFGFPLVNISATKIQSPGSYSYHCVRNDPPGWDATYTEAKYAIDPLIRLIRTTRAPFAWDRSTFINAGAADLWDEQAPYGFHAGISATVHNGPQGYRYVFGMDRVDPLPKDSAHLMRMLADLQLMAAFIQDTVCRLMIPEVSLASGQELTIRERDVLAWASQGKTAWETGMLLSISEHTVNKHLASAARRLGCTSKAQAVARAIERGML